VGQKLLEALQSVSPEEAEKLLSYAEQLKKQQATAKTVQSVEAAKEAGASRRQMGKNYGATSREASLAGVDMGDTAAALSRKDGGDREEVAKLVEYMRARGTAQQNPHTGKPGRYGSDVEGAIDNVKGAKGMARGDQYAAVDKQGTVLATRNEYPSIKQHWAALGDGGEASRLSFAMNLLEGLSRGGATAGIYAQDAYDGKTAGMSLPAFARDMKNSVLGEKEGTVSQGGRAAQRGYGFGDFFRVRRRNLLEKNPNATQGEVIGEGPLSKYVMPDEIRNRPAADMSDEDFDFLGDIASFGWDPLNVVAPKAVEAVGWGASKIAPKATEYVTKTPLGQVARDVRDVYRKAVGSPITEGVATRSMAEAMPAEAAKELGRKVSSAQVAARAQGDLDLDDVAREAPEIAALLSKAEGPLAQRAAERIRDLDPGQRILALRQAAREGKVATSLVDDADLARMQRLGGLGDDVVEALGRTDDEIAQLAKKEVDDLTADVAAMRDDEIHAVVGANKHSDEVLEQLVLARQAARRGALGDDDILNLRRILGVESEASAFRKAKDLHLKQLEDVQLREWDLARAHDVDLFQPLVGYADNVTQAAKRIAGHNRRAGAARKDVGLLNKAANLEGRVAHPPKPALGGLLRKPYNPFARRIAVASENVSELAHAARQVADDADALAWLTPDEKAFVKRFAEDPQFQGKNAAKAKALFDQVQQRTDVVDDANAAVRARTGGRVEIESDPIKAMAIEAEAAAPHVARARLGKGLAEAEVTFEGKTYRVAEDPAQLLADAPDALKRRYLDDLGKRREGQFEAPVMTRAGDEIQKGNAVDVAPEVRGYLENNGWVLVDETTAAKLGGHLAGKAIPAAFEPELRRMAGRLEQGSFERIAGLLVGPLNKLWIPLQLNTPGFHVRNWLYGEFQTYLALGRKAFNPLAWERAFEVSAIAEGKLASDAVIKLGGREWRAAELASLARKHGVVETGLVRDLEKVTGTTAAYKDQRGLGAWQRISPFSQRGLLTKEPISKVLANRGIARLQGGHLGQAGSSTTENFQRMRVFLGRLEEGDDVIEAASAVTKYLFDYTGSQLSQAEKALRRVLPFYQWLRFSTVQTVEQMLKQPQKFGHMNRLFQMAQNSSGQTQMDPVETPPSLVERGATYAPEALLEAFGLSQSPTKKWGFAPERPGAQLNFIDPLLSGKPFDFLEQKLLPAGSPAVRVPAEMMTGHYAFGGGEISPTFNPNDPGNSPLEQRLRMKEGDMAGYAAQQAGPIAGLVAAATGVRRNPKAPGTAEDERAFFQALSTLTGLKLAPFDPNVVVKKRVYDDKEMLEDRAAGTGREARARAGDITTLQRLLLRLIEGGGP
jgi:hypothetical protein